MVKTFLRAAVILFCIIFGSVASPTLIRLLLSLRASQEAIAILHGLQMRVYASLLISLLLFRVIASCQKVLTGVTFLEVSFGVRFFLSWVAMILLCGLCGIVFHGNQFYFWPVALGVSVAGAALLTSQQENSADKR